MTILMRGESPALQRWRRGLGLCVSTAALAAVIGVPGASAAGNDGQAPQQVAQAAPSTQKAAASDQLETIVVTSRYEKENLQETPISTTAVTADDIEKKGFTNLTDLSRQVPNLKLDPNQGAFGNTASVFIRGIGQADFHPALDPGVGIYLDGVYYGSLYGDTFDLSDIQQVEVDRGPQGTLFGRNTEGGAIQITTTQPKGDYSGYAQVGYGSYNRENFKGAFDVPIIQDKLALRVSAGINNVDGYVDTIDFACANPAQTAAINAAGPGEAALWNAIFHTTVFKFAPIKPTTTAPGCVTGQLGGGDTGNYHASLLFTPNDDWRILLTGDLLDIKGEEPASVTTYINPSYPGSLGFLAFGYGKWFVSPGKFSTYSGTTDLVNGYQFPNQNDTFSYGFNNTVEYHSPWGIDFKNILGYRGFDDTFSVWLGGSPIALDNNLNELTHRQISEEFQMTGSTDALFGRKLEWAMGAYYYIAHTNYNSPIVDLAPFIDFFPPFSGENPAVDTNTSGFVHGIYHITDELSTEVGVRYSTEEKDFAFDTFNPAKGGNAQAFAGYGPHEGPFVSASERFDPKVELDYHITPDFMTYASVSTGYKGGGVNPRPSSPSQLTVFKPEDLTAYELGEKSQWFDNKVRFNADIFLEDFKDLQTPEVPPGSAGSIYINTGHVLLYGTEIEGTAQPIPGLQFDSTLSWLHNRTLSEGNAGACPTGSIQNEVPANASPQLLEQATCQVGGPVAGQKLPAIPAWKASIGAQYAYDLPSDTGVVTPRLDWHYQSTEFLANQASYVQSLVAIPGTNKGIVTQTNVPVLGKQGGYGLWDARLTYDSPDGNWTAAFEVHNLANKYYYVNGFGLLSSYGNLDMTPGLPRTYFFSIKRMFQPSAAPVAYTPPPPPAPTPVAPAAVPAPAPEAQREFQVFFDFDKSNITEAAAGVIQQAAAVVKSGGVAHVTVTGHTDTVGTAKYNQALSERRAAAVKAEMVKDGVDGGEISTMGVGKTGLLVPTADGVREPQNRRAVIELK